MKKRPKIILASASPRRKELLSPYFSLQIYSADIDESVQKNELPLRYVKRISLNKWKKAASVFGSHEKRPIVAADTTVVLGKKILGKPENKIEARKMLKNLSGKNHDVITSVVVGKAACSAAYDAKPSTLIIVKTKIFFRKLFKKEIEVYLKGGEWRGKAGGYAIQGGAVFFVKSVHGSLTNVIGLPLVETINAVVKMLSRPPHKM